ncbi:nitrate/nitrite transporter [Ornithinimicrobium sp. LYQ103]|uniref:MFS transporter n=1 Tax=Ornithinimicrobium sp. LYQ103 TaxID=3378796 RepID=UPI003854DA2C
MGTTRALVVWGVALAAYVIAVTGRTSLGVAGPAAIDRFSISAATLATFSVIQLSVYAAAQIPAGLVLDRVGSRAMIAAGALLMGAGQLMLALADTMPLALAARVLIGLGDAATLVSVLRLLPVWFRPRVVPMMTQVSGILGQLGQVISAVPFLVVLLAFGWVPAFGSLAGAGLVVALLVLALVRDLPPGTTANPAAHGRGSVLAGLRVVVGEPGTWLGFFTHFVTLFPGNMLLLLWGVPFFTAGHGLSAPRAGALLTVAALSTILIGLVLGDLVGRYPARRSLIVLLTVAATTLVWAGILLPATPRPFWQLTVLAVVSAAGMAACTIGFDFARTSVPHAHLGTATGLVNVGGYLASVLAILLVGLILDLSQPSGDYALADFRLAFAVGQAPLLLAGVAGVLLARRAVRRRELRTTRVQWSDV